MMALVPRIDTPEDPDKVVEKIDRILYTKKKSKIQKAEVVAVTENKSPQDLSPSDQDKKPQEVQDQNKQGNASSKIEDQTPTQTDVKKSEEQKLSQDSPDQNTKKVEQAVTVNSPKNALDNVKKPTSDQVAKENVKVSEEASKVIEPKLDLKSLKDKFGKTLSDVNTNKVGQFRENAQPEFNSSAVGSAVSGGSKNVGFVKSSGNNNQAVVNAANSGNLGEGKKIVGSIGGVQGFNSVEGRTIILGSLDPKDVINVLKLYIPKFAFCYEQELERIGQKVATTLDLKFTITSNGQAKDGTFESRNLNFSSSAISCFSQVLYSIPFPKPKGGGVVKIRQPINMEPKF